jgi:hypothetical protein
MAFRSLENDDAGRKVLGTLSFKGVTAATDMEWNEIRKLKIEQGTGRQP